ncbi:MAG: methylmalonyl Co-A mutase-associated GTPase MeaB [Chloroflexi bacterium AL-W]|nr:methylmalonyl Co-A mutase-associated GTPase MeaB [Chloroflexi bacterium AL-W]
MNDVTNGVLNGNRRAIARALTWVENQQPQAEALLAALYPHTGRAWVIGVTGAPGTGKSSLVNVMAKAYRQQGKTVGVIAVDPTSPFSGGAILGDRIRMKDHSGDAGVFIRSMATRGSLGGLSVATRDSIRVLDAGGFDVIIVETVGAGQSEVDIVRTANTTLVVEAPGLGDDVQAIKAGILEIADILVVNKSDRPGASSTTRALNSMLEIGHPSSRLRLVDHHGILERVDAPHDDSNANTPLWLPRVVQTIATDSGDIEALMTAIEAHQAHVKSTDMAPLLEAQRIKMELVDRLREALVRALMGEISETMWMDFVEQVQTRQISPQQAIQNMLNLYHKKAI